MNIDRKRFPILEQIQKGKLSLPLTYYEYLLFGSYLPKAESIIRSKPIVDYLCLSQFDEVWNNGTHLAGKDFDDTKGVLLTPFGTYIYDLKNNGDGHAEVFFCFYEASKIRYSAKAVVDGISVEVERTSLLQDIRTDEFLLNALLHFLLFKKHVEIKQKIISTKTTRNYKTSSGSVKTDFKYPINIIDAYYFTNYVKIGSTEVKAHQRHYKSGKVVNIQGHPRSGYSRKAKKLSMAA